MSKNNLFNQTVIYAIGEIAPKIVSFFLLPIYTNYLTAGDYGIVSYTSSIAIFIFVLASLSLNSYVLRFYYEKNTEIEQKELIGNVYLFMGAVNLLLLVLGFLIMPGIIARNNIQVPWNPYFKLTLLTNFLDGFSIIPSAMYRVKQKAKQFVALSLSQVILQFILTYLFIVIMKKGIIGHFYGRLFSLIPFFIVYWIVIIKEARLHIDFKQIKEGLRFSLPLLPGAIAYLALNSSDRIIMERSVSIADIGIYNVAFTLAFTLNMVIQSGYRALEPEFFKRYKSSDFPEFARKTQSLFLAAVYVMAMGLTLFSQEVFKLLTSDEFYKGYLLVPIIIIGAIMTGQNVIFRTLLAAEKNTKAVGFSALTGAFLSIVFNLFLIPVWGIYAAAFSSAVSYFGMNIYLFVKMNFPGKNLKSEFLALGLFIIITFSVFYGFKLEISYLSFFIKGCIMVIFSLLILRIFKLDLITLKAYVIH